MTGGDLATRHPASKHAPVAARLGCALLVLLGVVRSLVICLRRQPDADMSTVPLVAEAVRYTGLSALSAWHYTQDNWLLSVIVPELPLQILLHPAPWLPAVTGWLFFAGTCLLTALLALPSVGRIPAALLGATLLFASPAALTGFGFLAHPTSHDVTTFWCLLGLLAIMRCLRGGGPLLLLPAAACLLIATISDPWAKAAFVLPLSLAAIAASTLTTGRMRRIALLVALATLPCWLAGDHAFGLLPTMTAQHFDRGPLSAIPAHLHAGLISLGLLFDIGTLLPASAGPSTGAIVSLVLIVGLCAAATLDLLRHRRRSLTSGGFLMLVCLLSAAGTLAAFGLSAMPADTSLARLVLNQYFTIPLFLCLALAAARSGLGPTILAVAATLFVAAGLTDHWQPIREHSVGAPGWQTRLTDFLQAHDLHYGYGGYWGSDANSSRVRTADSVTIRPVSAPGGGLPIQPNGSQTFDAWYWPGDLGADTPTRFFVADPDPDLCANRNACFALAVRSFGPPARLLDWEGHAILVWSHPILFSAPSPAVLDALPPITPDVLLPYLWTGWTVPDRDGSWMRGANAMLMLPPSAVPQCLVLRAASGPDGGPVQTLLPRIGATDAPLWQVPPRAQTAHCLPPHPAAETVELAHDNRHDGQTAPILLVRLDIDRTN